MGISSLLHHVGSRDPTQVVSLGGKCLYPSCQAPVLSFLKNIVKFKHGGGGGKRIKSPDRLEEKKDFKGSLSYIKPCLASKKKSIYVIM